MTKVTKVTKKAIAEAENKETLAKKARVTKKGTAKVVKKPAAKSREVEVTDEEAASEDDAFEKAKPKGNSRTKAVPKTEPTTDDEKKPQATATPQWMEDAMDDALTSLEDYEEAYDSEMEAERRAYMDEK